MKVLWFLIAMAATQPAGLNEEMARVDAQAGKITDLTAHFQQKKFTALLKRPLLSSGTARDVGATVRWDTESPQACSLFTNGVELRLYYPDEKLEEVYPIDAKLADLLASPLPRLDAVRKHFSISRAEGLTGDLADAARGQTLALRLTPSDAELAKHVREVVVVLDETSGVTKAVQTTDADGDRTEIVFSEVKLNTGISARSIELEVPAGTTISHPLAAQ